MNKEELISLIDMMQGLSDGEKNKLKQKSFKEIESDYVFSFLSQNDEQLELIY